MPTAYKVLAQAIPGVVLTNLYTVPGATSAIISTVTICNQSASATTYKLSIGIAGAADTASQYLAFNAPIAGNDTVTLTLGIGLATTDVFRCFPAAATLSFSLFGCEIT